MTTIITAAAPSWTDRWAVWIALGAGIVSLFAIVVAVWNARSDSRAAKAAERAEKHAETSADVARASLAEAKRVADAEVDRDHNFYEPALNGVFVEEGGLLFYEFSLTRDYDMRGRATGRGEAVVSDRDFAMRTADRTWRTMIDAWAGHTTASGWDTLTIKFWPPAPQTGKPVPWTCQCGRENVSGDGPGHWQWTIGVPQSADGVLNRSR